MKQRTAGSNTGRIFVVFLSISLVLGNLFPAVAYAANANSRFSEHTYRTGLLSQEVLELPLSSDDNDTVIYHTTKTVSGTTDAYAVYSNTYFYDRMSTAEKKLYDDLYGVCRACLTGTDDLTPYRQRGAVYYLLPAVQYSGLTTEQAANIVQIFDQSNPQFYFLNGDFAYDETVVQQVGYAQFADGAARASATSALFSEVSSLLAEINTYSTDLEKERAAHNLLAQMNTYNYNVLRPNADDERYLSQSCYSAFMLGTTVCAGYSEALELLLNAVGITTIAVTSEQHEWNEVYLDGWWYLVDLTWDDDESPYSYEFFNKSEATVYARGSESLAYHTPESFWETYRRPLCLYDYGYAPYDSVYDDGSGNADDNNENNETNNGSSENGGDGADTSAIGTTVTYDAWGDVSKVTVRTDTTTADYVWEDTRELRLKTVTTTATSFTVPATVNVDGVSYKVTAIAKNAMKGNATVKTLTIGKYVQRIGTAAFSNCKALTTVTMGKNVSSVTKKAFQGDSRLRKVTLQGAKVSSVGKKAFTGIAKNAVIRISGATKRVERIAGLIRRSGIAKTIKIKEI